MASHVYGVGSARDIRRARTNALPLRRILADALHEMQATIAGGIGAFIGVSTCRRENNPATDQPTWCITVSADLLSRLAKTAQRLRRFDETSRHPVAFSETRGFAPATYKGLTALLGSNPDYREPILSSKKGLLGKLLSEMWATCSDAPDTRVINDYPTAGMTVTVPGRVAISDLGDFQWLGHKQEQMGRPIMQPLLVKERDGARELTLPAEFYTKYGVTPANFQWMYSTVEPGTGKPTTEAECRKRRKKIIKLMIKVSYTLYTLISSLEHHEGDRPVMGQEAYAQQLQQTFTAHEAADKARQPTVQARIRDAIATLEGRGVRTRRIRRTKTKGKGAKNKKKSKKKGTKKK